MFTTRSIVTAFALLLAAPSFAQEDNGLGKTVLPSKGLVWGSKITLEAHGSYGVLALHAAVLNPRLHVDVDRNLPTWRSMLDDPIPRNLPENLVPGVLLHYDIDDLAAVIAR